MIVIPKVVQTLITSTPDATRVRDNLTSVIQPALNFLNAFFAPASDGSLAIKRNLAVSGNVTVTGALTSASLAIPSLTTGNIAGAAITVTGDITANGKVLGANVQATTAMTTPTISVSGAASVGSLSSTGSVSGSSVSGSSVSSGNGFCVILDCGTYWNTSYTASSYVQTQKLAVNFTGNGLGALPYVWKFTRAGSIVGWCITNTGPVAGTNWIQINKNYAVLGYINAGTGGSGSTFWASAPKGGTYSFAAGDTLTTSVANTAGGNFQVQLYLTVELSA